MFFIIISAIIISWFFPAKVKDEANEHIAASKGEKSNHPHAHHQMESSCCHHGMKMDLLLHFDLIRNSFTVVQPRAMIRLKNIHNNPLKMFAYTGSKLKVQQFIFKILVNCLCPKAAFAATPQW